MNTYAVAFNNLLDIANAKSSAQTINGRFTQFCDYIQYITFDALQPCDYPNGIKENSIYLIFSINYQTNKVELHSCGHVWLSNEDKNSDKYKYYAMRSMAEIALDYGVKKFRKQGFKSPEDLFKRMETYYVNVMAAVRNYTNNIYPYKNLNT